MKRAFMPPSVTLEARSVAHAEELFAVLAEPRLYKYLDEAPPASVEALRAKLARSESRKSPDGSEDWLNWIVRDSEGRLAGYVQATILPGGDGFVAYVLGSAHWGRGIATAAVAKMLDILAAGFPVQRFLLTVDHRNRRSIKLAQRLGFTPAWDAGLSARPASQGDLLFVKRVPCAR